MIFQSLVATGGTRKSYGSVTLGEARQNFYGDDLEEIQTYFAPSYGRVAQAEILRDQFLEDIQHASAVYCLGRNGLNTTRPASIPVSASFRGDSLDTPEAFRQFLAAAIPGSTTFTTNYASATNASIFILRPAQSPRAATSDAPAILPSLSVLAVYDIDLTPTESPEGTYVSVRRYAGGVELPTDYYDVFYPQSPGAIAFNPLVAWFGRGSAQSADPMRVAAERPFYFVWWPDPASHSLEAMETDTFPPSYSGDDPRAAYAAMGGRTSLFFVVPMFPAL